MQIDAAAARVRVTPRTLSAEFGRSDVVYMCNGYAGQAPCWEMIGLFRAQQASFVMNIGRRPATMKANILS